MGTEDRGKTKFFIYWAVNILITGLASSPAEKWLDSLLGPTPNPRRMYATFVSCTFDDSLFGLGELRTFLTLPRGWLIENTILIFHLG